MAFVPSSLETFFAGEWVFERDIDDRRRGQKGRFSGQARFAPEKDGLGYHEEGELTLPDYNGPAERSYRYSFPAPLAAEVAFHDGRFFHRVDLSSGRGSVRHLCGQDLYEGSYRLESPDAWCLDWRVTGPRKDLWLCCRFRRRV